MKLAKRKLGARKRIALVAHDHKKLDLMEWAVFNKAVLSKHELFATGTTGKLLEDALDRPVKKLLSGPLGGDQQIGGMIATGELDILIFFSDPMETQPHDSDVRALQRISSTWNVPMAGNRSTADFLMTSRFMNEEYEVTVPNYENYLHRKI
jgi:methylglyoxal synthase